MRHFHRIDTAVVLCEVDMAQAFVPARFWAQVDVRGLRRCWVWMGQRCNGYGVYHEERAHRFSYRRAKGAIPPDAIVRHLCGNKLCVNPSHLRTGTDADNAADGKLLRETVRGTKNGQARLNDRQVRYILENPDELSGAALGRKFQVSRAAISLIRNGKRWAHV